MGFLTMPGNLYCNKSDASVLEGIQDRKGVYSISNYDMVGMDSERCHFFNKLALFEGNNFARVLVIYCHS